MKIRAENLSHHYRTQPVLDDVSFSVQGGELVAIMGPNGMGKSTALKCVAGALSPIKGRVIIDGHVRNHSVEEESAIRQQVVYLPDHPWLPIARTGRELLYSMAAIYDVPGERIFDHMDRLLDLFQLCEKADANIHGYSNGQKKKIAIAAALITEAPILILDEPFTGGLDPSGIHALKEVLTYLSERSDITIMMASQIPEIVEAVASRVLVMKKGKIIAEGSPADLNRMAGDPKSGLSGSLEALINPETSSRVERYFS